MCYFILKGIIEKVWNVNICNCLLRYINGIFLINDRIIYYYYIMYFMNELNIV